MPHGGGMNQERILFEAAKLALTRVEAADALDVSPATLDRLVKRGLKIGRAHV